MKKILTGIAITIFLSANIHAQPSNTWKVIPGNPFPEQESVMAWSSSDTGFFFGSGLARTVDSGIDFVALPFPNPTDTIHLVDTNGNPYVKYNHYSAIQSVTDMAWPAQNTGVVVGPTGSDNYGHTHAPTVLVTQDGGTTWSQYYPTDNDTVITKADTAFIKADTVINRTTKPPDTIITPAHTKITPADTVVNPELWNNIYFPNTTVGYASAGSTDGTGYITKTTDGGKDWTDVYHSDTLSFNHLHFINANNGIFIAQGQSAHLGYTTDGGATVHLVSVGTDSTATFLHWNNDSSWLVGADSVYRSKDSGKTWTSVVPYDTNAGPVTVGAFYDDSGFVFRQNEPIVLMTTDYGVTWTPSRLPDDGSPADSVTPLAASMVSSHLAYLLAFDNNATSNVLMKFGFGPPKDTTSGDVVQANAAEVLPFSAMLANSAVQFSMAPATESRSIEIMDVLGRTWTTLSLASNAGSAFLPTGELSTGTYFARLGTSIVKFAIP